MNMKLPAVVTPPFIYNGYPTRKMFCEEKFTPGEVTRVNMKIVVVAMLEKTDMFRMVRSTSPWKYCRNLVDWTR